MPVIASSIYRTWLSRPVEATDSSEGLVYVSYFDSSAGVDEYRYAVDTARGLVRKLEKYHDYGSGFRYRTFDGTFLYDETAGDVPILRAIALNGDTTLQEGGYRFFDVEVNTPLDDTLFVPGSHVWHVSQRKSSGSMPVFGARSTSFDLLGRALPSARGKNGSSGLRTMIAANNDGEGIIVQDQRDCRR